jgi:ADP-ribose pyrophosphatase YjhB (NUDIX family)
MKKTTILLTLGICLNLSAQTVEVTETSEMVNGETQPGLKTTLAVSAKTVRSEWSDYLKQYGKVSSPKGMKNVLLVEPAHLPAVSHLSARISSSVTGEGNSATVFYAIRLDSTYATEPKHPSFAQTKAILHDFGVKMYQMDINRQADEAQKIQNGAEKKYEQQVREGEKLAKAVERNKAEKINLDKKLAQTQSDSARLVLEIPNRQKEAELAVSAASSQQSVVDDLKIKKVSGAATADDLKKAEKELSSLKKQSSRKTRDSENAVKDFENAKQDRLTLLKKIQDNATQLPQLYSQIEKNKKDQAQARQEADKEKKNVADIRDKVKSVK